ncbi:hypothetical protein [Agrococcus sp. SGAir0287]|uniref:hypothetical protein n=1 Tax=Agrococcus sp. SGAir0287 TaxID=2070347 RepID=UPI0010CD3D78|nr:hypothetical protein [Agrococcus sp. SGAir0287]QCR18406.1 hypothetical protein C1N71_02190 [Agrococcus sp. SGAir0287]
MSPTSAAGERLRVDLLRRPASAWEALADVVRVVGAASIVVGAIGWGASAGAVLLLAASAAFVVRMLGLRGGADAAFGAVVLVAAWSGVVDVYRAIAWWDVLVHVACTGVVVAVALLVLGRAGVVAHPSAAPSLATIVLATLLGLGLGALWEIVEWLGHALVDDAIFVAYDDTIGDLASGGLGALAAGVVAARMPLERPTAPEDRAR